MHSKTPFPASDAELIAALGGPVAVAKLINLEAGPGRRRVHNWIARGIPSDIKLRYPQHFLPKTFAGGQEALSAEQTRAAA